MRTALLIAAGLALAACGSQVVQDGSQGGASTISTGSGAGASTAGAGGTSSSSGSQGGQGQASCPGDVDVVGECDLLLQDCPVGERCNLATAGDAATTTCEPDTGGDNPLGSYCESHGDCADDLLCILEVCSRYCCPNDEDPPCGGWYCDLELITQDGHHAYMCTAESVCVLFDADSCPPGYLCVHGTPNHCVDASSPGAGEGEPCIYLDDCAPGLLCNAGSCRYVCDTDNWGQAKPAEGGCPPGQQCLPIEQPNVGLCTP